MPYSYLEHAADIGIRAEGATMAEAIEAAAEATLGVIFGLDTISEGTSVAIKAEAPEPALLLVEVLNELLSIQDRDGLALKRLETKDIAESEGVLVFTGSAFGETLDPKTHELKTEVKAATYSGLSYSIKDSASTEGPASIKGPKHVFECVIDV